jgi:hypothetical protein
MKGFLIFLAMFIGVPLIAYIFVKNSFGRGKYNNKDK